MKSSEILIATKVLLENEEHWCQGHFALDAEGNNVAPAEDCACKFDLMGAFYRICYAIRKEDRTEPAKALHALAKASRVLYKGSLITVNDAAGHVAVLAVLNAAIAAAVTEEGSE